MYTLNCVRCGQARPRAEYRKRGGGVHKLCPDCRKKDYNERARLRAKIRANKETLEERVTSVYIRRKCEALQVEFNKVTTLNRVRIRKLQANPKPTRATIRNLKHRLEQQAIWRSALEEMLTRVQSGERIDLCLRDYIAEKKNVSDGSSDLGR